jgi:hypothetical protein
MITKNAKYWEKEYLSESDFIRADVMMKALLPIVQKHKKYLDLLDIVFRAAADDYGPKKKRLKWKG